MSSSPTTSIHDLPDVILTQILSLLTDTRTRNSTSLVSRKWSHLERLTRYHLILRGTLRDLPFSLSTTPFTFVTHLDLSLLSPYGLSLSTVTTTSSTSLLPHLLRRSFPSVTSLTLYSRSPSSLSLLSPFFPFLTHIKLLRYHQRPPNCPLAADLIPLFHSSHSLSSLDLSSFYFWTEDIPPALTAFPAVAAALSSLDLLNSFLSEGFKSHELLAIANSCPNLRVLKLGCVFDPRYLGFVGDEALLGIVENCREIRVLHLVDVRGGEDEEGEAGFSVRGLVEFFSGLGFVEELVFDVGRVVRESWVALEVLGSKCCNLRSLKLGSFDGICKAIESHLDGIAICYRLESLCVKNCRDLSDLGLIEIGRGCCELKRFEIEGCGRVTMRGLRTMVCLLMKTLVEVRISRCRYLDAGSSLQVVEPIHGRIRWLHIDCVWDGEKPVEESDGTLVVDDVNEDESRKRKRIRLSSLDNGSSVVGIGNGYTHVPKRWDRLEFLSLWIAVGELLSPLGDAGLEDCPNLSEIHIKVEGDCREGPRPSQETFGISSLERYPKLSKMKLDCGDTIGYALTAPSGHMDLSLWERFFLFGLRNLRLNELDYWPPQDREVNQRSLSLPAAGLLAQCDTLRKLFIHGTAHEHFMNFLLAIPNLRDVQLRGDYYPAPENDTSTEMRVDSCCRFERKLNDRFIPD